MLETSLNPGEHCDPSVTDCTRCVLRAGVAGEYGPTPVDDLCSHMRRFDARARQVLFAQGTVPTLIYFLQAGRVKLERRDERGKAHIVAMLGPGDLFGFSSITQRDYTATAEALTACEVCVITPERLEQLMTEFPGLGVRLLAYMHQQVVDGRNRLSYLGSSRAATRVAGYLLDWAEHSSEDGISFPRDLTLVEISGILGISPETISRTLTAFGKKSWIKVNRKSISLLAPEQLRRLSD